MKRSRAPSSLAAAAHGTNARQGHASTAAGTAHQEESQQSLEVDVGMEDIQQQQDTEHAPAVASGKPGGRRRSSRGTAGGGGGGGGRGNGAGSGASGSGRTRGASNRGESPAAVVKPEARDSNGANGAKPRRGAAAKTSPPPETTKADGEESGSAQAGESASTGAGAGSGAAGGDGSEKPPPKKKKKYIRNPETHKEYRARMEAELAQARKMLEEGNAAMVELARDYKRQQAVIEHYRSQDNSLISISQLSQSQPTAQAQQQQQQQQQAQQEAQQQLLHQHQHQHTSYPPASYHHHQQQQQQQQPAEQHQQVHPQMRAQAQGLRPQAVKGANIAAAGEGVAGAGVNGTPLEALLECSQETLDREPEMSQLSQDIPLSQTSAISLSMLETDEPLSQATQWLAAFQDSQEAWSLDDLLLSQEVGGGDSTGDKEGEPDSVEAVALAAEALSPSRQGSSSSSRLAASNLSPMRPPPPHLIRSGGSGGDSSSLSPVAGGVGVRRLPAVDVVRVGVACMVTNPGKPGCVLVGKRKGSLGAGTLALPGGHLEVGEEWATCASREVLEETGLEVETPTFSWVINTPGMEGGRHYVTIFMLAAVADPQQEPIVMEPDKCEGWSWEPWKSLGVRKSSRARPGKGAAPAPARFAGERLFKPLATLRSTTYNPFRGVL